MTATGPTTSWSSSNRSRTRWVVAVVVVVGLFVAALVARSAWRSHQEDQWLERLHGELAVLPVPSAAFLVEGEIVDTERRPPGDDSSGWDWGACRTYAVDPEPFVAADAARDAYVAAGYTLVDDSRKADGFEVTLHSPDGEVVITIRLPFSATGPPWESLVVCAAPNRSNWF